MNDGWCDDGSVYDWGDPDLSCNGLETSDCGGRGSSDKDFSGIMNREGEINGDSDGRAQTSVMNKPMNGSGQLQVQQE